MMVTDTVGRIWSLLVKYVDVRSFEPLGVWDYARWPEYLDRQEWTARFVVSQFEQR